MLVKTVELKRLLKKAEMTSSDLLRTIWQHEGNIYSVIPKESFIEVKWTELEGAEYAVMSYQWLSQWGSIGDFILLSENRVLQPYMWIDALCLDQLDPGKMMTIQRSDEIYFHAKAYHLMELGSLTRGWVLFELSSVKPSMLPPKIHLSKHDPASIDVTKQFLRDKGFDGCEFTEESDRKVVRDKIILKYGTIDKFNLKIVEIVNHIFI